MIHVLILLCDCRPWGIGSFLTSRSNFSANFGDIRLQNAGRAFILPAMKQKISISLKNVFSHRSFEPFISSSGSFSGKLSIFKSTFSNYRDSAISLDASTVTLTLANQTYQNYDTSTSFYDRSVSGYALTISRCYFLNCRKVADYSSPQTEGFLSTTCGGAIYLTNPSSCAILVSVFEQCHASSQGGAIFVMGAPSASVSISECKFISNSAYLGSAVCYYDVLSASVARCKFSKCYCNNRVTSSINTGTVVFRRSADATSQYSLTVSLCSFEKSSYNSTKPLNYAEVYGINRVKITGSNICLSGGGTPSIPTSDHLGIYITSTASSTGELAVSSGTIRSDSAMYLYYANSTYSANGPSDDYAVCVNIEATPQPTPSMSLHPSPSEVPAATPRPSPFPTPVPTNTAFPTKTFDPTHETTPDESSEDSSSMTEYTSDTTTKADSAEEGGLTHSEKVLLGWTIPTAVVLIAIIVIIIYCATKDRRTAFNGEDSVEENEEYGFPAS